MTKSKRELLDSYISAFWSLISSKIADKGEDVKEVLCHNSHNDFDFLIAARNVLEDASLAISHFQRFGLRGATKYDDPGESYLRLYGLLSAAYMQQEAILKILNIVRVPEPKQSKGKRFRDKFEELEIRALRHKLVAHSVSYENRTGCRMNEAYAPLRFDVGDMEITYINHTGQSEHMPVNLRKAIDDHFTLCVSIMDTVFEKAIRTLHKGKDNKKRDGFMEKVRDLRIEQEGGLVIEPVGGRKVVVTFIANESE